MDFLDFKPCLACPSTWMREAKKSDGTEYQEYVLLCTNNALVISDNAEDIIKTLLGKRFHIKSSSIGLPKIYLGGGMRKVVLKNTAEAQAFSSSQYIQSITKNIEKYLSSIRKLLPKRYSLPTNYRPELDISEELSEQDAGHYQSLIGILKQIIELD